MHHYSKLNPLIEHCVRTETVCTECIHSFVLDEKEIVLNIAVDNVNKNVKLNDLLQDAQNWLMLAASVVFHPKFES